METLYDWWAVAIFGAVAITWLSRSVNRTSFPDPVPPYAICAIGCAVGNWLGNQGYDGIAAFILAATLAMYVVVIRPLRRNRS